MIFIKLQTWKKLQCFTNFYAHSICYPTRISILTGQNSARHRTTLWIYPFDNNRSPYGPKKWNWLGLTTKSITLPRLLKNNGYLTIHIGKGHFGPKSSEGENPLNLGFDVNIAGGYMGKPGSYYGLDGFFHIKGKEINAVPSLTKYHNQDIYLTEALTLEAKKQIKQAVSDNKPFYLNMSLYGVHNRSIH
ncbi:sulfatase-like hydrolase/transferase [Lentisphaerota bacterium WC36G]|nr:sulfatase-like hydrolase/transferase [Lentisphaerae bacterium WC36]